MDIIPEMVCFLKLLFFEKEIRRKTMLTQIEQARDKIISPQMARVAEQENIEPETIRDLVA